MSEDNAKVEPKTEPEDTKPDKDIDWKKESRKWEKRAKENAEKAKSYDDLKSKSSKSQDDLESIKKLVNDYKSQIDEMKSKSTADALKNKISKETGVPVELISGKDEDSMREFAEQVAQFAKKPSAPMAKGAGKFANNAGEGSGLDAAKRKVLKQLYKD